MDGSHRKPIGAQPAKRLARMQAGSWKNSATTGEPRRDSAASSSTGMRRGEIGSGERLNSRGRAPARLPAGTRLQKSPQSSERLTLTALTHRQQPTIYEPPTRDLDTITRLYRSRLQWVQAVKGHSIKFSSAPSAAERAQLTARRNAVADALVPASPAEIARLVSVMLIGFPTQRATEAEAKQRLALYVSQIANRPQWAVKSACEKFLRGATPSNAAFAPSVAELASAVDAATASARAELSALNAILNAGVEAQNQPGDKAAMRASIDEVLAELRAASWPEQRRERPPTRQEAAEWLAEAKESGPACPAMSDALRVFMGKSPDKSEAA